MKATWTFLEWAKRHFACAPGEGWLLKHGHTGAATWAMWITAGGRWRGWVCETLYVQQAQEDRDTSSNEYCGCWDCRRDREDRQHLNTPAVYAALRSHYRTVIVPALRAAGVKARL